jgi:hypothetical protein
MVVGMTVWILYSAVALCVWGLNVEGVCREAIPAVSVSHADSFLQHFKANVCLIRGTLRFINVICGHAGRGRVDACWPAFPCATK